MKRKTKLIITAIAIFAIIGVGGLWYMTKEAPPKELVKETADTTPDPNVIVKINKDSETPKQYTTILDEETGKEIVAEVQENAPIQPKPTPPQEKPKANGSYTNPDTPPTYTKEQTVIEKKPQQPKETTKPQLQKPAQSTSGNGTRVYIDGFGYVEQGSSTQTKTGQSSGDINKMVGSMS